MEDCKDRVFMLSVFHELKPRNDNRKEMEILGNSIKIIIISQSFGSSAVLWSNTDIESISPFKYSSIDKFLIIYPKFFLLKPHLRVFAESI